MNQGMNLQIFVTSLEVSVPKKWRLQVNKYWWQFIQRFFTYLNFKLYWTAGKMLMQTGDSIFWTFMTVGPTKLVTKSNLIYNVNT